jgi:hypothetical protein
VGGTKWRLLELYVQSRERDGGKGKECSWQDHPLCRFEQRAPYTSSTILVPGYNINNFRAGSHKLAKNLNSVSKYQDQQGGIMLLLYFRNLDATTSNRAMCAEQNGDCWNCTSTSVNKMAAEVGKERSWQDDSLCRLKH